MVTVVDAPRITVPASPCLTQGAHGFDSGEQRTALPILHRPLLATSSPHERSDMRDRRPGRSTNVPHVAALMRAALASAICGMPPRGPGLLALDVRRLENRPPFLDLRLLVGIERLWVLLLARWNILAEIGEPLAHVGIGQG